MDEESIFQHLLHLEKNSDEWKKRQICTIDLNCDGAAFWERYTFDIDTSKVRSFGDRFYIPLRWRPKAAFFDLDCTTNSGTSAQLAPLSFRRAYMEYSFWKLCQERFQSLPDPIPICWRHEIHCLIFQESSSIEEICSGPSCEHSLKWSEICNDALISRTIELLGSVEPLIFSTSKEDDIGILKFSERKMLRSPDVGFLQRLNGAFHGVLVLAKAETYKILAPNDMRFTYDNSLMLDDEHIPIRPTFDLGWIHYSRRPPAENVLFSLRLVPRRSNVISSGFSTMFFGLMACLIWLSMQVFAPDLFLLTDSNKCAKSWECVVSNSVRNVYLGIPYGLLLSLYITRLPVFYTRSTLSYMCAVSTRLTYVQLGLGMALSILFPFFGILALASTGIWANLLLAIQGAAGIVLFGIFMSFLFMSRNKTGFRRMERGAEV